MSSLDGQVTSRLWPVLLGLVVLLAGAKALEEVARARGGETLVIQVHAEEVPSLGDGEEGEDGEADDSQGLSEATPRDDDHARARQDVRRDELSSGLALFAQTYNRHPGDTALAAEYGFWLLRAKQPEQALSVLQKAASEAPEDPRIALYLGRARARSRDLGAAEKAYRRALELRPNYSAARLALGKVLLKQDKNDEALGVLRQAAAYGSNDERARALAALGKSLLAAGKREEADKAFEEAIERAPARVEIRLAIARAYLARRKKQDLVRASGVLATAAELAPDFPAVRTAMGAVRERQGDLEGAADAYWQALRLDPGLHFARRRLLRIALKQQNFKGARAHAEQLLAADPDNPEHHFLAGWVAGREGNLDLARAQYQAAIEAAKGDYPEAYYNLGLLERGADRLEEAISAYRQAIVLRPKYRAAQNNLALTLAEAGRQDEAEGIYRSLVEKDPKYVPGWINLGKLLTSKRAYDEAIKMYQRALSLRPNHSGALLDLGVTYARSGRLDEAVATYQKLLSSRPRYTSAWYNLGLAQEASGRPAEAIKAYQEALAVDDEHAGSLRKLAALKAAAGQLPEAALLYENLLDLSPGDHATRLAFAEVLSRQGDAARCLREAGLLARDTESAQPGDDAIAAEAARLVERCRAGGRVATE